MRLSHFITWKERPFLVPPSLSLPPNCACVLYEFALKGEYNPELFIRTVNGWCFTGLHGGDTASEEKVTGAHMHINTTKIEHMHIKWGQRLNESIFFASEWQPLLETRTLLNFEPRREQS